jgi:hypothetical protein
MRAPPPSVVFVARTHWVVGLVILATIALLHFWTHDLRRVEFGPSAYGISGGLGALYLLSGTLVWFGAPLARPLSRICALLYLARPRFGSRVWDTMNLPEFQAHFERAKSSGPNEPDDPGQA